MRKKKVWRYYCDYCKKAGCSGGHLKHHEERCTLNPNRICGFCKLMDKGQSVLVEIIKLLPNPKDYIEEDKKFGWTSYVGLDVAVAKALPKVREAAEDCPACIMAALRQAGIPMPIAKGFDFKKECESIWSDFNDAQREENEVGYY